MSKYSSTALPLPMPLTSKDKYAVYITIGRNVEMFLYDGKQVFTPDFPDVPIDKFDIGDGRIMRQETLARICRYMMSQQEVVYNEEFKFWEALPNNPF